MRPFLFPAICILALYSCSTANKKPSLLNSNNLPSHFIELETGKTHRLRSPKGAILNIPAGAFSTDSKRVQLELKEAYTMADILAAGLQTRSDGKLLQSGGMIYLNAKAEGKDIALAKPVEITIPSSDYDEKMQLFKGEAGADSSINWVDPKPLTDTAPDAARLLRGEMLFKANCASCHKTATNLTGPPIAWATKRYTRPWLHRFIANPQLMMKYDPIAKRLMQQWKPTVMTGFPQLGNDEIDAILDYADNDARLRGYNPGTPILITDTTRSDEITYGDCGYDTLFYAKEDTSGFNVITGDTGLVDMGEFISENTTTIPSPQTPYFPPGMYRFSIDQTGWYNIDRFYEEKNNDLSTVQLLATPTAIDADLEIFLCIPKRKLLTEAYPSTGNNYSFFTTSDSIDLPLNEEAIIFAVGSNASGMYYGVSKFRIQKQQSIPVEMKPITREALFKALKKDGLDGISLEAEENEMQIEKKDCNDVEDKPGLISNL